MLRDELSVLAAFAVVAEERSFTKAAVRLGVGTSAISHATRGFEERLGVRLLARTTRTVAPTDVGQRLLEQLRPALDGTEGALTEAGRLREKPAGIVRPIAPPVALVLALSPKLARFARDYPDVVLDITTEDDSRRDLVAGRFDAGIHLGEFVQRDMVAVKVTREQRAAIVAAPSYFDSHPRPKAPRDLTAHRCIRYRMGAGGPVYRWEFEKRGREVTVSVNGADRRRRRAHAASRPGWRRAGFRAGGARGRPPRERPTRARARGLVRPVRRVLPLLPQPPAPAGSSPGIGGRAARVIRGAGRPRASVPVLRLVRGSGTETKHRWGTLRTFPPRRLGHGPQEARSVRRAH